MARTDISLTIENSRFTPLRWIIPSGQLVQLSIHNPKGDTHNLVVLKGQASGETDPTLLDNQYWSVSVLQNLTDVSFVAPAMPGEYRIVCSIDGHEVKGERGILVVVNP
jgi:plastocyanin